MEITAAIFILVMIAIAYIAFRILKRTLKFALRSLIFLLIVAIALTGGLVLWNMDLVSNSKSTTTKKSR